jgi:predicted PolB exonuclease-like 3'-5' exonuclease
MKIIGFDIETVPQKNIDRAQKEWLEAKVDSSLKGEEREAAILKIMGTNPYLGEIVCISLGELLDKNIKTISLVGTEKEILTKFWDILSKVSNTTFVSFNGLKFDVNFIVLRSLHHNIEPTNSSFLNTTKFKKYPHFDVMQWMSDWNYPAPNLDVACTVAGVKTSKEGEIKAKDVAKAFDAGMIKEIAKYCEEDVRATLQVYLQLRKYVRD